MLTGEPVSGVGKIAIVGSGLIGSSWAMIFASQGYRVNLFDVDAKQLSSCLEHVQKSLTQFEKKGHLRGSLSAEQQLRLISSTSNLAECLKDAIHVQECIPDQLELKKELFQKLDELATEEMVLASSSSYIGASKFSENLKHRENVLVAHPVNPPYFVPLVELIPAPWTKPEVVTRTRQLMEDIGQSPITIQKEITGFALNRIQCAIINECWHLVEAGVVSPEDIDKAMYDGLGRRYAFIGPLETMHLNANGMVDYCQKYREGILGVGSTFKLPPSYEESTAEKLNNCFSPPEKMQQRRQWRDECLATLSKIKKNMDKNE